PNAPEGKQVGYIQKAGSIYRDFNFAAAGSYVVDFKSSQRPNYPSQTLKVYCDNILIGTITPSTASFQPYSTAAFAVTAGNHQIKFVGQSDVQDATAFVDDVKITPLSTKQVVGVFESPVMSPNGWQYNPTTNNDGWIYSMQASGGSGVARNGSIFNN